VPMDLMVFPMIVRECSWIL